jgi:hypothetical protein
MQIEDFRWKIFSRKQTTAQGIGTAHAMRRVWKNDKGKKAQYAHFFQREFESVVHDNRISSFSFHSSLDGSLRDGAYNEETIVIANSGHLFCIAIMYHHNGSLPLHYFMCKNLCCD